MAPHRGVTKNVEWAEWLLISRDVTLTELRDVSARVGCRDDHVTSFISAMNTLQLLGEHPREDSSSDRLLILLVHSYLLSLYSASGEVPGYFLFIRPGYAYWCSVIQILAG